MNTTLVHLVRHGEVHNPTKVLYGRMPGFKLSARGRSQAAATAASFEGHDVAYLAASPLQRAQETAEPFVKVTGRELENDENLIESWNHFEGLRTKGLRSQLANPVRWRFMKDPCTPSWGEPYTEILARMRSAVERARIAAEGHEAILISHQLPIVTIQRDARGLRLAHDPTNRQCDLASVTSLVFRGQALVNLIYSTPAREI